MFLICVVLICVYLIGFAATMRLTNRDLDLSLSWPLITPILTIRALYVGVKYILREW